MTPGYVTCLKRFGPGGLQKIKEEMISFSALKQCPSNWTLLGISFDYILGSFLFMSFNVVCCVQCMFCIRHCKFVYVPSSISCCLDVNVNASESQT